MSMKRSFTGQVRWIEVIKRLIRTLTVDFVLRVKGYPALPKQISIDPGNVCNLKCPLCPTGNGTSDYPKGMMSLSVFKKVLKDIPSVRYLCLYNWGEPFLNEDIFGMITHASHLNITVEISTNFSFKRNEKFFDDTIDSGLKRLLVSLNGASQEGYAAYNIGGEFPLVLDNIRRLALKKKQRGVKNPEIVWKFVANAFNEHEIDSARSMAEEIGVEFRLERINIGDDVPDAAYDEPAEKRAARWYPKADYLQNLLQPWSRKLQRRLFLSAWLGNKLAKEYPCPYLYCQTVINPDAKVSPCCFTASRNSVFGDLTRQSFYEIWTGKQYVYARSLFSAKKHKETVATVCGRCMNFKKRAGKDKKL
jgi:MoaA/NifB/PqqE/SkfB family radical SAM enzyme